MTKKHVIAGLLVPLAIIFSSGAIAAGPDDIDGHGFAPVKGTRLFYEVRGTGPAVVLIHGGQLDCLKAARDEGPDQATELWLTGPFMSPRDGATTARAATAENRP